MVLIISNYYENFIQNKYQDLIFIVIHLNLLFTRIGFFEQKFFMKFLFHLTSFCQFSTNAWIFPEWNSWSYWKMFEEQFPPPNKTPTNWWISEVLMNIFILVGNGLNDPFMHSSLKVCKLLWIWSWHHLQIQTFGSIEDWVIGKN